MKTILKIAVVISAVAVTVPEADAVFGVRRRTAVVTAEVVETQDAAKMAQAQQQQAAAAKPPAPAPAPAPAAPAPAAAPPAAPAPAPAGSKLPLGTVVPALPPGCVSTPVGGVQYYYGGGNFYRAVFQGNNLVYVTAQPQ